MNNKGWELILYSKKTVKNLDEFGNWQRIRQSFIRQLFCFTLISFGISFLRQNYFECQSTK